jgi:hypothetical protein
MIFAPSERIAMNNRPKHLEDGEKIRKEIEAMRAAKKKKFQ